MLADLHSVDLVAAGLDSFGRPEGYVRRQVEGWCRRWADSATPDTVDVDATMQWLHDNMPAESGKASVIHNDYKLDNVIFSADNPLEVIGVLDWEMATVGDPLMDLGCTLGYWVQVSDRVLPGVAYHAIRHRRRAYAAELSRDFRKKPASLSTIFRSILLRPVPFVCDRPADLLSLLSRAHQR